MTMRTGRFLLVTAAFMTLALGARAQRYSEWRIYRASDGMAQSACVSVTAGVNNEVLAKHVDTNSISELDGYTVQSLVSPALGHSRVYESPGGQLWTLTASGLEEFRDDEWIFHPVPEITKAFGGVANAALPPVPMYVIRQSHVLILLPDELMEFNSENRDHPRTTLIQPASQTGLQKFLGMTIASDGSVWISGTRGLEHTAESVRNLKPGLSWREFLVPPALDAENLEHPIQDATGDGITCVADSIATEQKLVVHFDGANWSAQPMGTQKLRGAWRGPEGVTWVASLSSLFQVDDSGTPNAESEEVATGRYSDLAVETNGIFWLASAEGLMRYSPPLWKSPHALQRLNSPVPCLAEDAESRLWFVSGGALHSLENGRHHEHAIPHAFRTVLQNTRAMLPLNNGDLLLDTGDELYQFQPGQGTLKALAGANERRHTLGLFRDGSVAVESTDAGSQNCRLEKYDGVRFQPIPGQLSDCSLNALLESPNGDIWVGGDRGPFLYQGEKSKTTGATPEPVVSFVETADGKIWCATPDSILEWNGQNWTTVRAGFDEINSMIRSRDGDIWVASNGGVSRFDQGTWIENSIEEGLPNATARQVYEDRQGRIWVGTTRGLTLFHPQADPDPPRTRIRIEPGPHSIPQNALVSLAFIGEDRWKYTPPGRLLYSYRLDQHDWSRFAEANTVTYSDLAAGTHSLEVRAMDRNGNIEQKPAHLAFMIALPWYKETRLVLISLAGMAAALFFAALAFNRHRQLLRSYAEVEKKVAERTRELEMTSRELVHSQKMNALGTLAAGIAHDFNNILSIIKGSAQIIEDNVENSEKIRTRVDRIKTVVEQGAGIVKAMLGFSSSTGDEPVLCDLNIVVNDTIQLLGDRFQRDAAVLFKPEPGLPQVFAIKEFVQQVLLNFVFNAAEAESAAKRKQIILSLRASGQLPARLALAPAQAPEYVMVSVQDFGCGIPPENLPRIFEPFFTTKALSARRGTGLGLSMVYELARKLEAGLSVESMVDVGSTFTLILPVRDLKSNNQ